MVFKKRKNIPFKYVKFGSVVKNKSKKSAFFNQNITIQHLIDLDLYNVSLKCKKCKTTSVLDTIDIFVNLGAKKTIQEALKIYNYKCNKCSNNEFLIF